jgi:aminopeptidase N
MDEGFTSYASNEVMNHLRIKKLIPGDVVDNPHIKDINGYINFALSGNEEALITHSDHYVTNTAYGVGSYTKGEVLLEQIKYIIGDQAFETGMLRYFETWKFKHPNANDFFRIMEKVSGLELDWFREYFVNTTHKIDYEIEDCKDKMIYLRNRGILPMPLDITVKAKDGKVYQYYIPQEIMRGEKKGDRNFNNYKLMEDWAWTHPTFSFNINLKLSEIESIEIDASKRMADIDRGNNVWPRLEPKVRIEKE